MFDEVKSANFERGFGGKLFFARKSFPPSSCPEIKKTKFLVKSEKIWYDKR